MVEKLKPYRLPTKDTNELAQHRQNLVDGLAEIDKAEECGIECQELRAKYHDAIARIDTTVNNFGSSSKFRQE
jgi:hypothetical protein